MRQLIRGAVIVNGDGHTEPYEGDALIDGDRIARLGSVPPSEARTADATVEGRHRMLCPGFVDTHNHGALAGTRIGPHGVPLACELALRGGVVKRICGVDGLSPAPVAPDQRQEYAAQLEPLDGTIDGEWAWSTTEEFYRWHRGRSVTDMGLYLGHSAVRRAVMGNVAAEAGDEQLRDMAEVVRREAPFTLGLSTGLIYNPAVYSDERELTELVRAFNQVRPAALFPHIRSESDLILTALDEVIGAAVDGGGGYCNEHSKIAGRSNWDKFEAVAAKIDDASGVVPTMENMYPWPSGSTTGDVLFPPEIRSGSREEFLARLLDPDCRRAAYYKMRADTTTWDNFVGFCGGLDGVRIAEVLPGIGDDFLGERLGDVARAFGCQDMDSFEAYEAVFDFVLINRGDVGIITHYGNEATMEKFFRRPTMAICTDGLVPAPGRKPHPRCLGAFPKALRMARQMQIPAREIVYRISTLPCEFLGLESPVLRPGADASLTLLDWDNVTERNNFLNPLVPPSGIEAVWVHGRLVHADGAFLPPDPPFEGRILLPAPPAA